MSGNEFQTQQRLFQTNESCRVQEQNLSSQGNVNKFEAQAINFIKHFNCQQRSMRILPSLPAPDF
jgi:hypothetical protein